MSLDNEGIQHLLEKFDADAKALKKNLLKMCWYMRGGITLDEIYNLSSEDRQLINKIVEENMEITEKTKLPFF